MFGVHTALITPFLADGSVDYEAFELLCDRQVAAGIHGLVPCGTTGEAPTLTDKEWDQLVKISLATAGGKIPVTAGVGTNNTVTTVANCERALLAGAQYGLMVLPYYNKPNPQGLRAHVKAAADVGLPLVLYHVPGRTAHRLGHELLAELANFGGIVAIKEATGDLRYGADVFARTATPILSGDDFTFLPLLSMGGKGVISVISNVDPAGTVAVYEHFVAGRLDAATAAMYRLWELCEFLFTDTNPVPVKAALAELGLCLPDPRLPLGPFAGKSCKPILADLGLT